jgi:uncharacterized iron-regulated membrane protein
MRLSARAVHRWDKVHTWSSLVCTLFLLVLCLTGLPLIFSEEVERLQQPPVPVLADGPERSVDALVEAVKQSQPRSFVQFVFWDDTPGVLGVGVADRADADLDEVRRILLDTHSGLPVAERPPPAGLMPLLLELHRALLAGLPGTLFLSLVAVAFLLSLISGIALYAPFAGERGFAVIRQKEPRLRWLDRHNVIGMACAAWLLVVGVTGLLNTLESPLFGAWQAQQLPALLDPYRGQPFPSHLSSVDAAVQTAKAALPGMHPTSVGFPYSQFGSPRHFLIWMQGGTKLTEHFFTPVLIDAADGHLAAASALPGYLRAVELSRPLHFGDYGGLPLKIVWALLDVGAIIILVSGVYLFVVRRRRQTFV